MWGPGIQLPGPLAPTMIIMSSNSAQVARVLSGIARDYPKAITRVLGTVGQAARKDVIQIMQDKHPIDVADQSRASKKWRAAKGLKRTLGGDMATKRFVYYKRSKYGAEIGISRLRWRYMEKFQAGNANRALSKKERFTVRDFYATIETDKRRAREIRSDYWRERDGQETKIKLHIPKVPARPVFVPYSRWPGLSKRITMAAFKALQGIISHNSRNLARAA